MSDKNDEYIDLVQEAEIAEIQAERKKNVDKIKYTIYFNLTKDDKGNWSLVDVSNADEEKILGIYAY